MEIVEIQIMKMHKYNRIKRTRNNQRFNEWLFVQHEFSKLLNRKSTYKKTNNVSESITKTCWHFKWINWPQQLMSLEWPWFDGDCVNNKKKKFFFICRVFVLQAVKFNFNYLFDFSFVFFFHQQISRTFE